jgi:hypothetical protein
MKAKKYFENVKKFIFVEKRIYFAEIEYDTKLHTAGEVARAYAERFPEDGKFSYEYDIIGVNHGVCKLFREKCYDFVEK